MIPKVTDYEVYKTYLGISRHFTSESYDYQKYQGKVRCSLNSFYKNKQRFWFEKLSRKYDDQEIKELFIKYSTDKITYKNENSAKNTIISILNNYEGQDKESQYFAVLQKYSDGIELTEAEKILLKSFKK